MPRGLFSLSGVDKLASSRGGENPKRIEVRVKRDRRHSIRLPTHEWSAALRRRAYELFLERGRENGRDVEEWLRAEDELRNMAKEINSTAA